MSRLEAIADPLRLRIVRHLGECPGAGLGELADAVEAHPNTVRAHLSPLEEAGVVVRDPASPAGRGRPAAHFRLADDWTPPTADLRGLAELLAAALVRSGRSPRELREIGLEWGRYLLGRPGAPAVERELSRALERLGFEAQVDGDCLRLTSCPCPLVAPDRPELVCDLAVAVADGVLTGARSGRRVGRRRHDPARRSCTAALRPTR